MIKNLEMLTPDKIKNDLEQYWPGFEMVAYVIFNKENVFLFNHPQVESDQPYLILEWNEQFVGSTLILYKDYPTAIVDLDFHEDFESLYSLIVHELFHGYQYLKGEKRFPDEILGLQYPTLKENVELRNMERRYLYDAVMTSSPIEKKQFLTKFINFREKRTSVMKEFIQYENYIESVEGPAWYVELKVFDHKSSLPFENVLQKYSHNLLDKMNSSISIRISCYASGLFICLLMDEVSGDWQEKFLMSDKTLFDFFKEYVEYEDIQINDVPISIETEEIIDYLNSSRVEEFEQFTNKEGYHLYIEGNITSSTIDPMNIIPSENKLLHKNYLKAIISKNEYLFQTPVISYFEGHFRNTKKLHIVLDEKPIENNGSLLIKNVGEIKGQYSEVSEGYYLIVE